MLLSPVIYDSAYARDFSNTLAPLGGEVGDSFLSLYRKMSKVINRRETEESNE